ncbi:FkbM family methyltransferase [Candidatus Uhrbacteria bacterium]|nr:FkbM family methyltransferase [Candidatus Uhrbacteria bacterium]
MQLLAPRRRVRSRGLQFTLSCDNWITEYRWKTYNSKEPETLDWIDQWLQDGDIFFDIGANIGLYSIYAALRHPRIRVMAFEPEYANLHLLKDNILANNLEARIEVYSLAFSSETGLSHLHIQDATPGAALHTESREPVDLTREQRPVVWREGIYAFTLDDFCQLAEVSPHHLKLDVDGTEPEILEGASRTLRSEKLRSLFVEIPSDPVSRRTCRRLLEDAGLVRQWYDSQTHSPNEIWARPGERPREMEASLGGSS